MEQAKPYIPQHKIRIVTAASLFDGHDAAINIMRRIIQATGCEVIHLGHDRSVEEVVDCAIQEDAQAIAMTSYQGGHTEYFKYMYDLLREKGAPHIKIFGGGGGTILPSEIEELQHYGITRIYHPDDGRAMGLQGMINDLIQKCDFAVGEPKKESAASILEQVEKKNVPYLAHCISAAENYPEANAQLLQILREKGEQKAVPVLGITGTGGAGKSSFGSGRSKSVGKSFTFVVQAICCAARQDNGQALCPDLPSHLSSIIAKFFILKTGLDRWLPSTSSVAVTS
jgi:methylmalonyl-CoA mutase